MGRKPNDQLTYFVDRLFKRWQCYIKAEERIKLTEFTKKGENLNVLVSAPAHALQTWKLQITSAKLYFSFQSLNVLISATAHGWLDPDWVITGCQQIIWLPPGPDFCKIASLKITKYKQSFDLCKIYKFKLQILRSFDYHLPLIFAKLLL